MVICEVQIDEENKIRIPDEIIQKIGLKPDKAFSIYIDPFTVNQDLEQQLIVDLTREGIIIEMGE